MKINQFIDKFCNLKTIRGMRFILIFHGAQSMSPRGENLEEISCVGYSRIIKHYWAAVTKNFLLKSKR